MATAVRPHFDTGHFFQQLAQAQQGVLVLDFETTLARLSALPVPNFPYPQISDLLDCIAATGRTRLIVVSTRPVTDLASVLAWPDAEIWASDGLERVLATTSGKHTRVPLCVKARPDFTVRRNLVDELSGRCPVAYVVGDPSSQPASMGGFCVLPELHLDRVHKALAMPESLLQFLIEWLHASAGEIC